MSIVKPTVLENQMWIIYSDSEKAIEIIFLYHMRALWTNLNDRFPCISQITLSRISIVLKNLSLFRQGIWQVLKHFSNVCYKIHIVLGCFTFPTFIFIYLFIFYILGSKEDVHKNWNWYTNQMHLLLKTKLYFGDIYNFLNSKLKMKGAVNVNVHELNSSQTVV